MFEPRELERSLLISELEVEFLLGNLLIDWLQVTHQTSQFLCVQLGNVLNNHQIISTTKGEGNLHLLLRSSPSSPFHARFSRITDLQRH